MDANQGQAVDQEPEMTAEQIAANTAADADFEAAFTNANGDEPGTEESTSRSTAAPAAEAEPQSTANPYDLEADATGDKPAAEAAPAPADDEDAPVTLTRRQLNEMNGLRDTITALQSELRQSVEKTNGRFGSIQQTMKQVQEQATKGIRPSFGQMEAMEEAFPELARAMKADLEKAFGEGNATQPGAGEGESEDDQQDDSSNASGADAPGAAPAVNPLEAPEVKAALYDAQLAIVDARHEGWRALPATAEWQAWQQQLPPAAAELLRTTSDAQTLTEAIADFKGWQQKQTAATSASNQRGKRLEHAVPATNGSSAAVRTVLSEDDAFEAGFKEVRKR